MSLIFIGFIGFIFIGMTLANRILEGAFIGSADVANMNSLTIFTQLNVFGLFSLPVPNLGFLTGIFHLIKFDYSYFGGNAGFILYFLYSLSFAVAFGLFVLVISLLWQYFNRGTAR